VAQHWLTLVRFGLASAVREGINPFCARGGLFEIEQFAMWLRIERIASLEMLQARHISFKTSQ
jgi:hypothetical protein